MFMRRHAAALNDATVTALAETFKVLGDTTRVRILDALSQAELCVHDLAERVGISESAVSHQLRLLRGMRLVRTRRDGRLVYYAIDDQHIVGLFLQGLEHVQERTTSREARATAYEPRAASRGPRGTR
jgi:DNA-binding transcriptional ArsR family regulator